MAAMAVMAGKRNHLMCESSWVSIRLSTPEIKHGNSIIPSDCRVPAIILETIL